jgi:CBS domain-containing protein
MQAEKIHVRDVMQPKVVKLEAGATLREAIGALREANLRGAPVVDAPGHVVGVVSLVDLIEALAAEGEDVRAERREYYLADPLEEDFDEDADDFATKEDYSPEALPGGTVADCMNPDVLSVTPQDDLRAACRLMIEHRVHRLIVLEHNRLVGILSTFDVVRRVAER